MKKAVASLLAALSISAFAAWDRVGSLQVADVAAQGEAAAKVGQMIGNPFAAAALAAALADLPTVKFFGPAREKATVLVPLFLDKKEAAKDPADALDDLEYAVLYPMSISKEEFLKRHEGAFETNGVVVVKGDLSGEDEDEEKTYVVFSKDGKWAGASDDVEQAKLALADVKVAEKPLKGEVARLRVGPKAVKAIVDAFKAASPEMTLENKAALEALKSFAVGLKVSDRGIDMNGSVTFAEGSEFAKVGLKPLGADPFAFADKGVCAAGVQAEDSGNNYMTDKKWSELLAVLKKHGVDISAFVARNKAGVAETYVLDIAALAKYITENMETLAKVDSDKLTEEVGKIGESEKFAAKAPAYANAVSIKGFASQWTVGERFAATLPEAADKKPFWVYFCSISSFIKAVAPHLLALVPEEQRAAMKPVVDTFAVETKTGIAGMMWRPKEGGSMRLTLRLSADEIRGVGGIVGAAMSFSSALNAAGASDADEDDDGDDED